jgi:hypothetical protein
MPLHPRRAARPAGEMGKPFIASSKAAADRIRRDAFSATMKDMHFAE